MKTAQQLATEKVKSLDEWWIKTIGLGATRFQQRDYDEIQPLIKEFLRQAILEAISEDREQIKEMVYKVNNPFLGDLLKNQHYAAETMKGLIAGMIYELEQGKEGIKI